MAKNKNNQPENTEADETNEAAEKAPDTATEEHSCECGKSGSEHCGNCSNEGKPRDDAEDQGDDQSDDARDDLPPHIAGFIDMLEHMMGTSVKVIPIDPRNMPMCSKADTCEKADGCPFSGHGDDPRGVDEDPVGAEMDQEGDVPEPEAPNEAPIMRRLSRMNGKLTRIISMLHNNEKKMVTGSSVGMGLAQSLTGELKTFKGVKLTKKERKRLKDVINEVVLHHRRKLAFQMYDRMRENRDDVMAAISDLSDRINTIAALLIAMGVGTAADGSKLTDASKIEMPQSDWDLDDWIRFQSQLNNVTVTGKAKFGSKEKDDEYFEEG